MSNFEGHQVQLLRHRTSGIRCFLGSGILRWCLFSWLRPLLALEAVRGQREAFICQFGFSMRRCLEGLFPGGFGSPLAPRGPSVHGGKAGHLNQSLPGRGPQDTFALRSQTDN